MKAFATTCNIPAFSDSEYIIGLKSGDTTVTRSFFYGLCSYILNDIRYSMMQGKVDYDELVGELYLYLSADSWRRIDTYAGVNGSSLKTWMSKLAWRYFMQERSRLMYTATGLYDTLSQVPCDNDAVFDAEVAMDVESTLRRMPNQRYAQVLRWMLIDGFDADEVAARLDTTAKNVYNIKHRAIAQFVEVYSCRK